MTFGHVPDFGSRGKVRPIRIFHHELALACECDRESCFSKLEVAASAGSPFLVTYIVVACRLLAPALPWPMGGVLNLNHLDPPFFPFPHLKPTLRGGLDCMLVVVRRLTEKVVNKTCLRRK